jgi:hypothetical protein
VRRAFGVVIVLLLPLPGAASAQTGKAARLSDISVTTQGDTATIFVKTSAPPKYQADLIDTPTRLVIDFEETEYAWRKTPLPLSQAPLKQIRGSQYRKDTARVVVEFTRKVGYAIREDENGLSIVIPTGTTVATTAKTETAVASTAPKPAAKPDTSAIVAEEKAPAVEAKAPEPPKPVMSTTIAATPAPRVNVVQAPRSSAPTTPAPAQPAPAPAAPVVRAPAATPPRISLDLRTPTS